ncbi:MAG: hypothetical protein LUM44_15175 [Pyrinomonadaceae bacterium]|nr:hypothetical protein [Pyrinomonadaceae bacterium]
MESGHNKNVAYLQKAIIAFTNLGGEYEPPQNLIKLPELQTLHTASQTALGETDTAEAEKAVAVDELQAEFEGIEKYAVNIKRQVQVELNDPAFTANLQTVVNKFTPPGRRTGIPDDPLTPDIDESRTAHSQSQISRDNQIAYLADISALLKTRPEYKGLGTPYSVAAVDAKIAALTAKLNTANAKTAALARKFDARDAIMYDDQTGIIARFKLIKPYLILKFGKDSTIYKEINALEFRKVK